MSAIENAPPKRDWDVARGMARWIIALDHGPVCVLARLFDQVYIFTRGEWSRNVTAKFLVTGELLGRKIVDPLQFGLRAFYKHLAVLREFGLVSVHVDGVSTVNALNIPLIAAGPPEQVTEKVNLKRRKRAANFTASTIVGECKAMTPTPADGVRISPAHDVHIPPADDVHAPAAHHVHITPAHDVHNKYQVLKAQVLEDQVPKRIGSATPRYRSHSEFLEGTSASSNSNCEFSRENGSAENLRALAQKVQTTTKERMAARVKTDTTQRRVSDLRRVWEAAHADADIPCYAWSQKEYGQAAKLLEMWPERAGDISVFVRFVVTEWYLIVTSAFYWMNKRPPPNYPQIGFLLAQREHFFEAWQDGPLMGLRDKQKRKAEQLVANGTPPEEARAIVQKSTAQRVNSRGVLLMSEEERERLKKLV